MLRSLRSTQGFRVGEGQENQEGCSGDREVPVTSQSLAPRSPVSLMATSSNTRTDSDLGRAHFAPFTHVTQ